MRIGLEVGKLVVGRELGVRLGIALDLRHLDDGLPAHSHAGVLGGDRAPFAIDLVEHHAPADVRVVRNRHEVRADPLAGLFEPCPEVLGFVAVEGAKRDELARLLLSVRHEHHAVKVVAARRGGPLPADQGSKRAGHVVTDGRVDDVAPCRPFEALLLEVRDCCVAVDRSAELMLEHRGALPRPHHGYPPPPGRG